MPLCPLSLAAQPVLRARLGECRENAAVRLGVLDERKVANGLGRRRRSGSSREADKGRAEEGSSLISRIRTDNERYIDRIRIAGRASRCHVRQGFGEGCRRRRVRQDDFNQIAAGDSEGWISRDRRVVRIHSSREHLQTLSIAHEQKISLSSSTPLPAFGLDCEETLKAIATLLSMF